MMQIGGCKMQMQIANSSTTTTDPIDARPFDQVQKVRKVHTIMEPRITRRTPERTKRDIEVQEQKITMAKFAKEIFNDLNLLTQTYKYGILLSDLQEYYGEPMPKIRGACKLLENVGKIIIEQNGNGSYFVVPTALEDIIPIAQLSDLQRQTIVFLVKTCNRSKTNKVQTGYYQLARVLKCSFGGLKGSLQRLQTLGFLAIEQESTRGHQNELLIRIESAPLSNKHILAIIEGI